MIEKKKEKEVKPKNPVGPPVVYSEKFVLEELELLLNTLKEEEDIVYLGELFVDKKYSRQRYSEWLKTYETNEEIIEMSDTIKEILETRAVKGAITNKLNSTFTIFHLKNNYKENWKDKLEVDNTNLNIDTSVEEVESMESNKLEELRKKIIG